MKEQEKLDEWSKMDFSEKQKYNGFNGFCNGKLFKDDNAFMREDKAKLQRRLKKEKMWRDKRKKNNKCCTEVKNGKRNA